VPPHTFGLRMASTPQQSRPEHASPATFPGAYVQVRATSADTDQPGVKLASSGLSPLSGS
jgi:hypothetical protein